MTSHFSSRAMVQNAFHFVLGHTPSHNLICAVFVENWIIPLVVFNERLRGKIPHAKKFAKRAYQGGELAVILNKYSSEKASSMGNSLESSSCLMRERWSATRFSTPFLSQIFKLNSWRSKTHLINLGLASFFASKYLRAE